MSLLMDALKKAEKAKQGNAGAPGRPDADVNVTSAPATVWPELSIDPRPVDLATELGLDAPAPGPVPSRRTPPPVSAPKSSPEIGLEPMPAASSSSRDNAEPHLGAAVGAPAAAASSGPGAAAPVRDRGAADTALAADRLAAKSMFSAKQPPSSTSRAPLLAIVATLLAAGAGAVYVWTELQPAAPVPAPAGRASTEGRIGAARSGESQSAAKSDAPAQPPASPPTEPPPSLPPPKVAIEAAPAPPPAPVVPAQPPVRPDIGANPPVPLAPPPVQRPTSARAGAVGSGIDPPATVIPRDARRPGGSLPRGSDLASARGGTPVQSPANMRISLDRAGAGIDPNVAAGYAALAEGNIEVARENYARALNTDANDRDALLGMAAVAQRSGRTDAAEGFYRRILELYPRDPFATAQLTAMRSGGDAAAAESRVKTLLAEAKEPAGAAPLSFALGNQMSAQGRWPEAQQAYFNAHAADPENPDYCYNLAVSLDQIHQPRLALQHYARALELARTRKAGFDTARAAARMDQLANAAR